MKTKKQRLRGKADKLFYEVCVKRHNGKCELTDQTFALQVHHFFPKSLYSMLRYDIDNGVVMVKGLHFSHHHKGDPTIHQRIIDKRGKEWYNKLLKKSYQRLKRSFQTISYYNEVIKKLSKEN